MELRPRWRVPRARWLPLGLVAGGAFVFALSYRVFAGPWELLRLPWPLPLDLLGKVFRATGRFTWLLYYLVLLAALRAVLLRLPRRRACLLLAGLLALQVFDLQPAFARVRAQISRPKAFAPALESPAWDVLVPRYRRLCHVLPSHHPKRWNALGHLALRYGLPINAARASRSDRQRVRTARTALLEELIAGRFAPDALYIFGEEEDALWELAVSRRGPEDLAAIVDTFRIIAPGAASLAGPGMYALPAATRGRAHPFLYAGGPLRFASDAPGRAHLLDGWQPAELWGSRAEGAHAQLYLELPAPPAGALALRVAAWSPSDSTALALAVNGHALGTWTLPEAVPPVRSFPLPPEAVADGRLLLELTPAGGLPRLMVGLCGVEVVEE